MTEHPPLRVDILTLFPEMFEGPLHHSILKRAKENGVADFRFCNFREFAVDRHRTVDDTPYGGGPGMVLMADPLFKAVEHLRAEEPADFPLIYLSPKGRRFDQGMAGRLAGMPRIAFLCGRYEGVDQRVIDHLVDEEISLGDFVLSGGEPACIAVLDAVCRLVPGAIGHEESLSEESFNDGLLEYPQYTRPEDYRGWKVPEVLLSGNHAAIRSWRKEMAVQETRKKRPDLIGGHSLSEAGHGS